MVERTLSEQDRSELRKDYKAPEKRKKGDRRKALHSFVDPAMDRRKGDRRK